MKFRAFTLIELLIVIAVMGVLATVVLVMVNPETIFARMRNAQRKEDLKTMQNAVEKYYAYHGVYPSTSGNWCTTSYEIPGISYANCSGNPNFGLTTTGELKVLPKDPKAGVNNPVTNCGGPGSSYLYISDGVNYKILAHCTPEGTSNADAFSSNDPFYDPIRPTWAWQVSSPGGLGW